MSHLIKVYAVCMHSQLLSAQVLNEVNIYVYAYKGSRKLLIIIQFYLASNCYQPRNWCNLHYTVLQPSQCALSAFDVSSGGKVLPLNDTFPSTT